MKEILDLNANSFFFHKALTLVSSHEKVWLGCQNSICKNDNAAR